jgi:hypothetical protein
MAATACTFGIDTTTKSPQIMYDPSTQKIATCSAARNFPTANPPGTCMFNGADLKIPCTTRGLVLDVGNNMTQTVFAAETNNTNPTLPSGAILAHIQTNDLDASKEGDLAQIIQSYDVCADRGCPAPVVAALKTVDGSAVSSGIGAWFSGLFSGMSFNWPYVIIGCIATVALIGIGCIIAYMMKPRRAMASPAMAPAPMAPAPAPAPVAAMPVRPSGGRIRSFSRK